jgi:peptide-methionine (R)-S-oxide reductase
MSRNEDRSEQEWREKLTPQQYEILRECGTEPAFTGEYWDKHDPGSYLCAGCGTELFRSDAKYDSGTGWPSFWQAVDPNRIQTLDDFSGGRHRIEVRCAQCGGHLGHLFSDGPQPTGMRYCINSASLQFRGESE